MSINVGDIAVFHNNPTATRKAISNSAHMPMTVYPGDVVRKGHETTNYQFYWFLKRNDVFADAEFDELRDSDGYAVCTRDEWNLPNGRFKYDEAGHIAYMGHILMYRPEKLWRESRERALAEAQSQGSSFDDVHSMADEMGIDTFEEVAGGERKQVVKARRR